MLIISVIFQQIFCQDTQELEEQVLGSYRNLSSFLVILAELYIVVTQTIPTFLHHFGSPRYHFRIALGADAAPFEKNDESTAWLLSFLNIGKYVQRENDNFLCCGANCSKTHTGMQKYARKPASDIAYVEKQT